MHSLDGQSQGVLNKNTFILTRDHLPITITPIQGNTQRGARPLPATMASHHSHPVHLSVVTDCNLDAPRAGRKRRGPCTLCSCTPTGSSCCSTQAESTSAAATRFSRQQGCLKADEPRMQQCTRATNQCVPRANEPVCAAWYHGRQRPVMPSPLQLHHRSGLCYHQMRPSAGGVRWAPQLGSLPAFQPGPCWQG